MHANTLAGRVALALGVFAPAALAQQTTVKAWIPFMNPGQEADEYFSSIDVEVISTTGNAVVAVLGEKALYTSYSISMPTVTVGPNTFHYEYTASYEVSTGTSTYSETDFLSYDCTFVGCPEATTGSCTYEESGPDDEPSSNSFTLASSDLQFHALTLATPLPTPLDDTCEEDGESEEATASRTGKDAEASGADDEDDDESAGWRVAAPWAALVPAVVLGFVM